MVSKILYFHPYLGKIPISTDILQLGWNHQLVIFQGDSLPGNPLPLLLSKDWFAIPQLTARVAGINEDLQRSDAAKAVQSIPGYVEVGEGGKGWSWLERDLFLGEKWLVIVVIEVLDVFSFFWRLLFLFCVFLANQKNPEGKFWVIGGCQESWCIGRCLHCLVWWFYDPLSNFPRDVVCYHAKKKLFRAYEVNSQPLYTSLL